MHADGETVICSVYGAGALKIGCGDRPILRDSVSAIFGYGLSNESYQFCVATNYVDHSLHIVDLNKGKEINASSSTATSNTNTLNTATTDRPLQYRQSALPSAIVDVCFFELQLSSHCAVIDRRGKIATFMISESAGNVEPQLTFESRLTREPVAIGITFDNQYLCAVSRNEFVLFAFDPLRFLSYHQMDGMLCSDAIWVFLWALHSALNDNRSVYVGAAQCWLFGCF